ncbi:MAG TPA: L,D-transpeptidase [Candidatus Nanopelagicales bacterium]|nr:L,D-transpeptidase [Candidatus Nanopelagicales bacterium]
MPSGDGAGSAGTPSPGSGAVDDKAAADAAAASLGLGAEAAPVDEEEDKPWWQRKYDKDKPLNITLAELDKDSDSTVAKRMVKGFFVAVDKPFGWNDRLWYKTTTGLVAPSDRMYVVKPPDSKGIDFPEGARQVGFILGSKASKYDVDTTTEKVKVIGTVPKFSAFGLTGESLTVNKVVYRKTTDGWWMKGADGTYAEPGPQPPDLAPGEKWVDVNLSRKTLVAMQGDRPVFATLISPGRRSTNKKKNHPTRTGTFRIREKHIAVTMDGDGTVAGDLPYSIEDVPFVAYYDGSYALHGAFWHANFGREMSHGCVNLSPLDAKRVFFWTEPSVPRGWHAAWSTPERPGTLVVIHE